MRLRIFKNMFKQGFQGMWRNRGMGLASVSSITAMLVILGLVLIIILSVNNVVVDIRDKFDSIQVFLEDDISDEQLIKIENTARNNKGISSVVYKSKEEALKSMKKDWEENSYLLEGLEENPLQDSFIIQLKDIEYADEVVDKIDNLEGIDEVKYYKDIIEKLLMFSRYVRIAGIGITIILIFVSIFIISNTIKITVAARKNEINIMKYVGATNGYIRGPFIIEGVLFGLIGAVLSILLVHYGYSYFFTSLGDKLYVLFSVSLIPPMSLIKDISIIFLAIGAGIGALGSLVSLKRFLNV